MAPEVVQAEHYDEKADIFSYGILLFDILYGKNPFSALPRESLLFFRNS